MDSIVAFLDMGGYAAYVWPSFVMTGVILAALLVSSVRFVRANEAALKALDGAGEDGSGET